jgi:hypothetical protein
MSYKKIEEATKALFKSDLEPFKDMVSKEVHCESIHKSSFGRDIKNYDLMMEMVEDAMTSWNTEPEINCLIDTPEVVVKTVKGFDPNFTYLEIDQLKDGKIIKHFYGKVPN